MSIGVHMPDVLARTLVTDQCWFWLGSRSTKGYGQIVRGGSHLQVHRIAFESEYGDIPFDSVIDHLCHDPNVCAGGTCVHRVCVRPDHLGAVSNAENLRRQAPAAKTHCVHGHELAGDNVGRGSAGHRFCKTCNNKQSREWRTRPRDVEPAVIREWARSQGLAPAVRGTLSKSIVSAYRAAHSQAA